MELLSTLGINLQLLIAQLINFGLLIAVLTYLVYKPILRVLDARKEAVAKSMQDVKDIAQQKKELEEWKKGQMQRIDREMNALLEDAKKQADGAKEQMVEAARKEAAAIVERAKGDLDAERKKLVKDVEGAVTTLVVKLTAKVLERQMNDAEQKRILESLEKSIPSLAT